MTAERDYSRMSPDELRAELQELYEYAPDRPWRGNDMPLGVNQEMADMMSQRLARILTQSGFTETMQKLVVVTFKTCARMGFKNEDRDILLGSQNPFTPEGAEDVGRRLIERYGELYQIGMDIIVMMQVDELEPPKSDLMGLIPKAEEEFKEKYGYKP